MSCTDWTQLDLLGSVPCCEPSGQLTTRPYPPCFPFVQSHRTAASDGVSEPIVDDRGRPLLGPTSLVWPPQETSRATVTMGISFTACLSFRGGGGIRTPGAFALRFSRPSPSTTRPLLRILNLLAIIPGPRTSRPGAGLVADDDVVGRFAEHHPDHRPPEPIGRRGGIRLVHDLTENGDPIAFAQHDLAVAGAPLLGELRQHALEDAARVIAELEPLRRQESSDVFGGRQAAFVPGRRGLIAPGCAHLLQADLGALHADQRRTGVVVDEQVLAFLLDDAPGPIQETVPGLRDGPVPETGRARQRGGERGGAGPQPADDLDRLAHPGARDRRAP